MRPFYSLVQASPYFYTSDFNFMVGSYLDHQNVHGWWMHSSSSTANLKRIHHSFTLSPNDSNEILIQKSFILQKVFSFVTLERSSLSSLVTLWGISGGLRSGNFGFLEEVRLRSMCEFHRQKRLISWGDIKLRLLTAACALLIWSIKCD